MTCLALLGRLIKLLVVVAFYGTPVVGFWLASSLAAYLDGPSWLPLASGLLIFPVLPALWELRAARRRQDDGRERILTLVDRLSLRTFAVGLAFLLLLLSLFPRTAFVSLSTRGDWMLDGRSGLRVDQARRALFSTADGLEWLYRTTRKNPYEAFVEHQIDRVADLLPDTGARSPHWPWEDVGLHPAVAEMPESVETSIESVARYIARQERDPFLRIKALHDYVADRIRYDAESFYAGRYPRQDAQHVFETRVGVCAGYANLLEALGTAIDEKIVVVVGHARPKDGKLDGNGHAWNAARIEGRWFLIDSTWSAGYISPEEGFTKRYSTKYLLPPPRAMILDHFPRDPSWQLLDSPLSQGDFLRQPMLRPHFFAEGLELMSPQRSQTEVHGEATVLIKNPGERWIMARVERDGQPVGERTEPNQKGTVQLVCPLPGPGLYQVKLFAGRERSGSYAQVGTLDFVNR